jgi:seryl-tRNA synthetase
MLQLNYLRENRDEAVRRLTKKYAQVEFVDQIIALDADRRKTQNQVDSLKGEAGKLSRQYGEFRKTNNEAGLAQITAEKKNIDEQVESLSSQLDTLEEQLQALLVQLPNVPNDRVPEGKTPEENAVVFSYGEMPNLPETAKPHWDLAAQYGLIDFELGNKLTGSGFPVYRGQGAKLQRALINFFLDRATAAGYLEVQPPILVNKDSGFGTGQLPDKEGQMYHVTVDDLYLIPTAEVPITNIYRDVILKAEELPIKNCGYTPCFRREAGSYGKDVRGLNRLHQFDKVEIVQVQHPDKSYEALEEMREYVAGLLRDLELPFRTLLLCGGDMSFASAMTYDMEVFSGAQKRWLEVSSVSNFETFQSNRLKLRYRSGADKPLLAHTLNGSALALPRIVAALLENNQTENGIRIPAALRPYTGFDFIK